MRFAFLYFLVPFFMLSGSAQNTIFIVHAPDSFDVYQLHLNEELTTANLKVYNYDDYPQVIAQVSGYVGGKLSGVEKTYYPSGKIYQTFVYADGKLWGEYMEYSEDGKLQLRGHFVNDQQHGLWIDKLSGCTGRYKNGLKHGRWRCNEGIVPYKLYVYRKGKFIRSKQK